MMRLLLVGLLVLTAAPARAQQRPSEEDIFGGQGQSPPAQGTVGTPAAPPTPATPAAPLEPRGATQSPTPAQGGPPAAGSSRDQAILGAPEQPAELSSEAAPENPLAIGGMLYLRSQTSLQQGKDLGDDSLSNPNLVDVYFDARPNERVRGFVLGRMFFDPTAAGALSTSSASGVNAEYSNTPGIAGFQTTRGPQALLDQMWIKFDIQRRVFVTAGKQHFKWGTGRLWTPTDFLHSLKRNPLSPIDARLGLTMLKLHVPWEERGWNFYGVVTLEQPNSATDTLGAPAAGGRAEVVLGPTELGIDGLVQSGQKPRIGVDFSAGIWDFDIYTDIAVRWRRDFPRWTVDRSSGTAIPVVDPLPDGPIAGLRNILPQAVLGLAYSRKYNDNDVITFGAEYFYNAAGYPDQTLYPIAALAPALLPSSGTTLPAFQPFYLGRHYAGVFVNIPGPYSWNYHTFNLSALGNLSDRSFVTRLDYSLVLLTHLSFEAYVMGHFGTRGGEFRFALDPNQIARDFPVLTTVGFDPKQVPSVPPSIVDLGVALRVRI